MRAPLFFGTMSKRQNIIFLDWDDTLVPTTFLSLCDEKLREELKKEKQLEKIECAVIVILTNLSKIGKICIVTNSEAGWIIHLCQVYFPNLLIFFANNCDHISMISAKSVYEEKWPNESVKWKVAAMTNFLQMTFGDAFANEALNILALGDNILDRAAIMEVAKNLKNCYTKNIKMIERPSLTILATALNYLLPLLPEILLKSENVDDKLNIQFIAAVEEIFI